jgi:di/tricarboxylate transporter
VVALCALLLAIAVGVVPFDQAFSGFSDDIVIIVGSALVVSAGVARSGLMQAAVQRFLPQIGSVDYSWPFWWQSSPCSPPL